MIFDPMRSAGGFNSRYDGGLGGPSLPRYIAWFVFTLYIYLSWCIFYIN